jgi:hypothetical protein
MPSQISPVRESEALGPLAIGVGVGIIGGAALTWMVGKSFDVFSGEDPPADTLGIDAYKNRAHQTAKVRKSTNKSMFIDNRNTLKYINDTAFQEGKKAAISALNDEKIKSTVKSEAKTAANSHFATIQENFLKSWNESVSELVSIKNTADNADGLGSGFIRMSSATALDWQVNPVPEKTVTLADGSTFTVKAIKIGSTHALYGPTNVYTHADPGDPLKMAVLDASGSALQYLHQSDWNSVWSEFQSHITTVESNIETWVDGIWDSYESGAISADDLVTPTDIVNEMAESDDSRSRAIANLMALNIPVESEVQATIEVQDSQKTTMTGVLATSDAQAAGTLSQGDTINPSATDEGGDDIYGDWFISHDISQMSADVTSKADTTFGIQGGLMRFTTDPTKMWSDDTDVQNLMQYTVATSDGDSATVTPSDFSDVSGESYWEVDLSNSLESANTDIDSVTATTQTSETEYSTVHLDTTFEVISANKDLEFEPTRDPQTDSNYITQEEWEESEQQTRDSIETWEETQDSGGVSAPSPGDLLSGMGNWLYIGAAALLGILALNAASS